ncbi:MAG: SDR family NAD(P)-dependent oxidoreductase, partial [Limisphaerales bacterium]
MSNEVAVVIGGTGALGGGLAEGLASAGAKVAILGRNVERGEARAKAIQHEKKEGEFFCADALSRESLRQAHEKSQKTFGALTILGNAAGGNDPK